MFAVYYIQSGPKKQAVVLRVVTSSVVGKFKEIPLLESLVNFQKAACNIFRIPSKCYYFTLQNGKQCKGTSAILQMTGQTQVISMCIE